MQSFSNTAVLLKEGCKSLVHEGSCPQMIIASSALHGWQHIGKVHVISCIPGAQMNSHEVLEQILTLV